MREEGNRTKRLELSLMEVRALPKASRIGDDSTRSCSTCECAPDRCVRWFRISLVDSVLPAPDSPLDKAVRQELNCLCATTQSTRVPDEDGARLTRIFDQRLVRVIGNRKNVRR